MTNKMEEWVLCESNLRLGLQAEKTNGERRHNQDLQKCESIKKGIKKISVIPVGGKRTLETTELQYEHTAFINYKMIQLKKEMDHKIWGQFINVKEDKNGY